VPLRRESVMPKIRGYIGEQSFELTEGYQQIIDRLAEAQVFSSTYRTEIERGTNSMTARVEARTAVESFRETSK
jgi:hypothetical protein